MEAYAKATSADTRVKYLTAFLDQLLPWELEELA